MENHPIPQDVTGFQFKLIGNMTVKQFAYLAIGVVFGWLLLQLPINIFLKFPFAAASAILGTGLAYFPIGGRPMDVMIGNYIKALFRPTEFVYEKTGGQIYFPNKTIISATGVAVQYKNTLNPFPKDKLKTYLESMTALPKNKVDERENNFLISVSDIATGNVSTQPDVSPVITIQRVSPPAGPPVNPLNPDNSLGPSAGEMPVIAHPAPVVRNVPVEPPQDATTQPITPIIKQFKPARSFSKPLSMPSIPDSVNLITGATKDARGNALSNILVEIKDSQGNPVRAFKTNELGRFASATPLINGAYTIEFEDPKGQNKFEKIAVNVVGQIINPIEATSIDTREELRRSLFATNKQTN